MDVRGPLQRNIEDAIIEVNISYGKTRNERMSSMLDTSSGRNEKLQSINIFLTDADRNKSDLSLMSDFLDGHVQQLALSVRKDSALEIVKGAAIADIGIINDVVHQAKAVAKGKTILLPDFDSLSLEIKRNLKIGVYTIGESRQTEGNLRAVILDENKRRVKDITLKKVKNTSGTTETVRSLESNLQMKQIYEKVADIAAFQQYQLDLDRDRAIFLPFYTARSMVLEAETKESSEERHKLLVAADEKMREAIEAVALDIKTTGKHFAKIAGKPFNNTKNQLDTYMTFLANDLQALNQYVGVRLQILTYLGQKKTVAHVMDQYRHILYDFLTEPVRKNLSIADLLQNYFPYNDENRNSWYYYSQQMKPLLKAGIDAYRTNKEIPFDGDVYIVEVEDVKDDEASE